MSTENLPTSSPLPHPPLCLALSVDAREDWGLPPKPLPGQAWVGTNGELWECLWELRAVGSFFWPRWEVHGSQGLPVPSLHTPMNPPSSNDWSDGKLGHKLLEMDLVCFLQRS